VDLEHIKETSDVACTKAGVERDCVGPKFPASPLSAPWYLLMKTQTETPGLCHTEPRVKCNP
jgi:hypothetical protein